jgi:hypothetical protein
MQATIVMLIALSGLGVHHKDCEPRCAPHFCGQSPLAAIEYCTVIEPSCYNPCCAGPYGDLGRGWARDGWGPLSGGYVGCFSGGAIGCGCGIQRFPRHQGLEPPL